MAKTKGEGLAQKPRDYEYAQAKVSPQLLQRIGILAATQKKSLAEFAGDMVAIGLKEFLGTSNLDLAALEAMETSASFNSLKEANHQLADTPQQEAP